jgi:hypothetical protein
VCTTLLVREEPVRHGSGYCPQLYRGIPVSHERARPGGVFTNPGTTGAPIMAAPLRCYGRRLGELSIREPVTILPQASRKMMLELVSIGTCDVITVLEQWRARILPRHPLGPRHTATVNEWKKLGRTSPGFFVGRSQLTAIRPTLRTRGPNNRGLNQRHVGP